MLVLVKLVAIIALLHSCATAIPAPPPGSDSTHDGICIHDQMVHDHEKMGINVNEEVLIDYGAEFHELYGIPRPGEEKQDFSSVKTRRRPILPEDAKNFTLFLSSSRQPIRITVYTHLLSHNADTYGGYYRTCYATGQTFIVGSGGGACGVGASDCTGTCTSDMVLTETKRAYALNTILPQVMSFFSDTLKVTPAKDGIIFSSTFGTCGYYGGVSLPKLEWPSTDYVLFLTARPTFGATIAWAGQCAQDKTGRPVAGHANWGPSKMYPTDTSKLPSQIQVLTHEITHALGFSLTKFYQFVDVFGRTLANPVRRKTWLFAGSVTYSRDYLVTPRVQEWTRLYFNCPTLIGAQLEDGGGSGTTGSHWEKRLYMNEYMTGTVSTNPVYTSLTIAALGDSGWYDVNYKSSKLSPLLWGRGLGCPFSDGDCGQWPGRYTCTVQNEAGCSADGMSRAKCNMYAYSTPLPVYYQHWSGQPTWGGASQLSDYCAWYSLDVDCTVSGNAPGDATTRGETYGSGSRCFASSATSTTPASPDPRCYAFRCSSSNLLEVRVGSSMWYSCPRAGGDIVSGGGFVGNVTCPSSDSVCPWPKSVIIPTYTASSAYSVKATSMVLIGALSFIIVLL